MDIITVDTKKPLRYMDNRELTYYRVALEVGDANIEACQDAEKWQELAQEFKRRGLLANAEKCFGRANYYGK